MRGAKSRIQFQKGLSYEEYQAEYGSEEACRAALEKARWPKGFVCPTCGEKRHCVLSRRLLYQCNGCRTQTSLTAGTIFHGTKLPLRKWFLAIYLITKAKNGVSSMQIGRDLGVKQPTAWAIKQKLMQVMLERENSIVLRGRVEADDAYLGGELQGGKPGRGSENKVPIIAAVETTQEGHPVRVQLQKLENFGKNEIGRWAATRIEMGTLVVTDGLASFGAVSEVYSQHERIVVEDKRQAAKEPAFKWVNTVLGNLKGILHGTYHAIRRQHVARYLAEFQYRFNRRFDLRSLVGRLVNAGARTAPMPYRLLVLAESAWPPTPVTSAEGHG
jgi:hypothetical protein